jgi:hypothetical protein
MSVMTTSIATSMCRWCGRVSFIAAATTAALSRTDIVPGDRKDIEDDRLLCLPPLEEPPHEAKDDQPRKTARSAADERADRKHADAGRKVSLAAKQVAKSAKDRQPLETRWGVDPDGASTQVASFSDDDGLAALSGGTTLAAVGSRISENVAGVGTAAMSLVLWRGLSFASAAGEGAAALLIVPSPSE